MKKNLLALLILLSVATSSFAQTAYSFASDNVPVAENSVSPSPVKYVIENSYANPLLGKFKNLKFDIKANPDKGMLTLAIYSDKHFTFLLGVENSAGDILIFEETELHEGLNIIPFATNGASVNAFDIKLSELKSAYSTSITLVKQ